MKEIVVSLEYWDSVHGPHYVCELGEVKDGRDLHDLVFIPLTLIVQCANRSRNVCRFAQQFLPGGVGVVTEEGKFLFASTVRTVVYELFPMVWADDPHVINHMPMYLGVKIHDSTDS